MGAMDDYLAVNRANWDEHENIADAPLATLRAKAKAARDARNGVADDTVPD